MSVSLDEQETAFLIRATDRNLLRVYSNDRVWIDRLKKLDVAPVREDDDGIFCDLDLSEFTFTLRRKRVMSEEQRAANAERLAAIRTQGQP